MLTTWRLLFLSYHLLCRLFLYFLASSHTFQLRWLDFLHLVSCSFVRQLCTIDRTRTFPFSGLASFLPLRTWPWTPAVRCLWTEPMECLEMQLSWAILHNRGDDNVSPIMLFVIEGCACAPFMYRCYGVVDLTFHFTKRTDQDGWTADRGVELELKKRRLPTWVTSDDVFQFGPLENHSFGKIWTTMQYYTCLCSKRMD